VSEELDIINDVLKQQQTVLSQYRFSLDPKSFKDPNIARNTKFGFESKAIDRLLRAMEGRLLDCAELRERVSRLAIQNVQLVETQQDENSKAILVFTVVTIIFLPPSFVTGFFGMNLVGIAGTSSTVMQFWAIAIPLTVGVLVLCMLMAFAGNIKRHIQARFNQQYVTVHVGAPERNIR